MTFDLEEALQSKREMRRELAARPITEKLAMLDVLRERALALRAATKMPVDVSVKPGDFDVKAFADALATVPDAPPVKGDELR